MDAPDPAQLEANKAFVRKHFDDFVNQKKSEVALQNFTADFYDHDEAGGPAVGPQAAKQMMEGAYQAFLDLHVTVEDILAEGDRVMVRNVWRGTSAQTGKPMDFNGFVLWRFEGGRIAERWATVTAPAEVPAKQ